MMKCIRHVYELTNLHLLGDVDSELDTYSCGRERKLHEVDGEMKRWGKSGTLSLIGYLPTSYIVPLATC